MVPMQMFASTFNYEVPKVTAEKRSCPRLKKTQEQDSRVYLRGVSNSKDSKLGKIRGGF